jgi:hypothetical protein
VTGKIVRIRAAQMLGTLLLSWPEAARACAVCFSGRGDETRQAFALTTVFLTVLPLLAIGGMVLWLRKRARQLEHERRAVEGTGALRNPGLSPRA